MVAALVLLGVLSAGGVIDGRAGMLAGAALELLLLLAVAVLALRIARTRRGRPVDGAGESSVAAALDALLPQPLARIVSLEPLVFVCLWRWMRRKTPRGPHDFAYAGRSPLGALVIVVLLTTPVELLLIELLLPWAWLRWLLLLGALYATLWLVGLYASLRVLPHQATEHGLLARYGLFNRVLLPWGEIVEAELERGKPPRTDDGLQLDAAGARAWLAIGARTDVRLELRRPATIERLRGATPAVTTLHIAADDPQRLVQAIRAQVTGDIADATLVGVH